MRLVRNGLCIAVLAMGSASAADVKTYFPAAGLGQFLVANFDLASVRSSFGPRRKADQRTLLSMGVMPTKVGADMAEFDGEDWYYGLRVLRRADINGDGIEDLEVCFTDRGKVGNYDSQQALLVTRYSDNSLAVALSFSVNGCETFAR